jgi:Ala-tRNA(Pro) deacylase
MKLESLLRSRGVDFDVLPHRTEYTASRTAQALHVPGAHFAKTVVLEVDGQPVLAVLQSNRTVDLESVRQLMGARDVHLAPERDFSRLFPDCELGAVPPFGSEFHMPTIVDDALASDDDIIFESDTHDRAVHMRYADYLELEHPRIAHIAH